MAHKKPPKPSALKKPVQKLKLWQLILLVAFPAIIYGRTILFDYVMHDDDKMIKENPMLKEGFNLPLAFTTDAWFMDARIELYRPWQSISYMMDFAIGKTNPMVYHIHNLVIYLLGVVLLFIFLQFYFKPLLAWAGAMLYAMNMLTPHVVGWIAARGDLYLMVFGLLFLILVQRYLKTGLTKFLWFAVPVFLMALLSKESAIALLFVAFVIMYVEKKKMPESIAWIWIGINALLFAGYFVLRGKAIAEAGNLTALAFFHNIRSMPEEFIKMIFPLGFSVMPGYSLRWTIAGVLVLGLFAYWVLKNKPEQRILYSGLAMWLGLLLPSMAYEPSFAGVAYDYLDHRAWFPFVGLLLIVLGCFDKFKFTNRQPVQIVFGIVLALWAGVNVWRSGTYQNWEAYYSNAIYTNPGSGLANLNYGSMLRDAGKWEDALPFIEKGVQLSPDYTDAKVRLAEAYFNVKKYNEAIEVSNAVIAKEPKNLTALQFRGSSYGASGQTAEAAKDFKTILDADPTNKHGLFNLGVAYKESNMLNEAIETYSKLISLQPDFPNAYYERGFCYGRMGLFPQAKADMDASIKYQPSHGASYYFRGRAWEALGDPASACADWKKALELGTKDAEPFIQNKCNQ
ncbi:MAG TPA: tetratricopeptide repeat protein [Saprospiraceae bacterium]|nr:tetratricopeptide repeat protein [Saprospiraceae bacterium]